jgi:hypothetical protein
MNTFKPRRFATSIGIALLIGSGLSAPVAAQGGDVALATI